MKNLFKDGIIILSIIFTIILAGCASGTANEIETDNQALQDLNKNVNALFNKKQTDIKESLSEEKIQDQFNEVAHLTNQFESDSADAQVYDKIFTKMEDAYEMFYLEKILTIKSTGRKKTRASSPTIHWKNFSSKLIQVTKTSINGWKIKWLN